MTSGLPRAPFAGPPGRGGQARLGVLARSLVQQHGTGLLLQSLTSQPACQVMAWLSCRWGFIKQTRGRLSSGLPSQSKRGHAILLAAVGLRLFPTTRSSVRDVCRFLPVTGGYFALSFSFAVCLVCCILVVSALGRIHFWGRDVDYMPHFPHL